jgi:hypothetical protein
MQSEPLQDPKNASPDATISPSVTLVAEMNEMSAPHSNRCLAECADYKLCPTFSYIFSKRVGLCRRQKENFASDKEMLSPRPVLAKLEKQPATGNGCRRLDSKPPEHRFPLLYCADEDNR